MVIDLDHKMSDSPLRVWEISKYIRWRRDDFSKGLIQECYVVYHNRAVCIDGSMTTRESIADEIKKLKQ